MKIHGTFILHILFKGDRDVLRILLKLLDAGSLVDSKNDQGLTPLLLTLKERKYRHSDEIFSKIVHCLIDHGADKHARFPGTQESTLCHAIDCRDLETAKCLIKAGYNVNTREEDGDLPIFRCVPFGNKAQNYILYATKRRLSLYNDLSIKIYFSMK